MWADIILAFAPSVLEALGTSFFDKNRRDKVQNKILEIIDEQFSQFADSSLDCGDFYRVIQSYKFTEIIRNYFFMINDGLSREQYLSNIEEYICKECPSVNKIEVRRFIKKIEELYVAFLRTIVKDYPEISASFQLMSISHREIISIIHDSQKQFERYLASMDNRQLAIDDDNIKTYHTVCEKEFSEIRFNGISGAERRNSQNINEFYVENTFSYFGKNIEKIYEHCFDNIETINLSNFFDLGNKIILIGGAGLGKTTTLNYLFCNYENLYNAKALKIKLDLKEYVEELADKKQGLLWCIANEFKKRTRYVDLSMEQIQSIVARELNDGKCLVILDALDEIPTQIHRDIVRNEIASFTTLYYLNRYIISTREAGYLKNRFNDTFLHIRINQFNSKQIEEYSRSWFKSYKDNSDGFEDFWDKFLLEVKHARCDNLISNPIILILALVIFDNDDNLPTRRIEFYQKCIETFLTKREERKAKIMLNEKARSILAMNLTVPKIAFYKYDKVKSNVGYKFSYAELEKSIMESIDVEDEINWITAVQQYSKYLVERTELIKEIDEDILDFAHKTFYEYFLAFYFTKMYSDEELIDLLKQWIGDSNFDELARLIIETIIQINNPVQHEKIIMFLFDTLTKTQTSHPYNSTKHDVFSVLADLYTHNLLQPKYQFKYNTIILFDPQLVDYYYFEEKRNGGNKRVPIYDSKLIAELFLDKYNNDKLIEVIDTIKYLNNEFKRIIFSKDKKSILYHIDKVFLATDFNYNIKRKKEIIEEFRFFLNEGLELTLNYPQLYTSVVSGSLKYGIADNYEKLLDYNFTDSQVFYQYTTPEVLFALIEAARESSLFFSLFMILLTECASRRANTVFDFVIRRSRRRVIDENTSNPSSEFCLKIWKALNYSNSFTEFIDVIDSMNLYNEDYKDIYHKVFVKYRENEMGIDDERIRHITEIMDD